MPAAISASKETRKPPVPVFLAATVFIFVCALSVCDSIGFVPDYIDGTSPGAVVDSTDLADNSAAASSSYSPSEIVAAQGQSAASIAAAQAQLGVSDAPKKTASAKTGTGIYPKEIIIDSVSMDLPVQNPSTTDVQSLDDLLVNGPARYVDSAELGENGNLLIFAHSSHLPIVHNKMFQAFNQVPNLKAGDSITLVGSDGKEYLYSVDNVVKATTDNGTTIDLQSGGRKLTLVTCDTLTGKSARFVLTADYVGVSNE